MKMLLRGACQCGAVRYSATGQAVTAFACHCSECQRQSASAFGMAAWLGESQLHIETGEVREWIRRTPRGAQMSCRFCSVCGSRLFHQVLGAPILSIKTGSLDQPSVFQPVAHIWTANKQPWVILPSDIPQFPGNPVDNAALMQAWEQVHGDA